MNSKKEPTRGEIEAILYQDAYWFRMPFVYFRILSPISAIVLAFLQREQHFCERHGRWFRFSVRSLSTILCLTDKQQRGAMDELTSRGFLTVRVVRDKGVRGSIRWLRTEEEQVAYVCRPHLVILKEETKKHWHMNQASEIQTKLDQGDYLPSRAPNKGDYLPSRAPNKASAGQVMASKEKHVSRVARVAPTRTCATELTDNTTNCGEAAPSTLSSGFGLLHLNNKEDTTFGDRCAQRLVKTLTQHRKVMRRPNLKKWASVFNSLEAQIGRKKVHEVLTWYRSHLGEKYVPVAYSAQAFQDKFSRIEECMNRRNTEQSTTETEEVVLTEEGKKALGDVSTLPWPKGAGAGLAASVGATLDQYGVWQKAMRLYKASHKSSDTFSRFIDQLESSLFTSPRSFVSTWYQRISHKAQTWEGWIPDLKRESWHPHHPEFQRIGRTEATAYFGDASTWDLFFKQIVKHIKPTT